MLPTAGFIPPPVVPLVPTAVNGIVATGGLLGGVAAGSLAGGRAGAIFGPKGAVAGAVIGGLIIPLLFPAPAQAPGTALDPGFNPKESPEPGLQFPEGETLFGPDPTDPVGTTYSWEFVYDRISERFEEAMCGTGEIYFTYAKTEERFTALGGGVSFSYSPAPARFRPVCSDQGVTDYFDKIILKTTAYRGPDNTDPYEVAHEFAKEGTWISAAFNTGESNTVWIKPISMRRDGVLLPLPAEPETQPIPVPNPIEPKPLQFPACAPTKPGLLTEPDPSKVPCPNGPVAPPFTIPKAPPAPPKEVPDGKPCPSPLPLPIQPGVVPIPGPVPGVPAIPEPSPDPSIVPAPGPAPNPLPVPGPNPSPGPGTTPCPDPQPSPIPIPFPLGIPGPGPITRPIVPGNPTQIDPGTGPIQLPIPFPKPTPPSVHFPRPGAPPVTGGGTRADLKAIAAEVGRIEQKVARLMSGEGMPDLTDWLWLLPLLQDFFQGDIPGTTYDLQGVCESVEQGQDQPVAEFPVAPAKNLSAIINRLDVLPDILQQHLAYRTPICHGSKKEGEFRTLTFISDEQSPNGKSRVVKRFRYRSSSGLGLPDIVEHWRSFTWQAGPVCVKHADAPWGTPQVWAASIDEGKRVIRHAAGEAGFDPDQVGRWIVGGSHNPRYGVPGTMRINTSGGYYMITARDGASERPQVVVVPPDL